MAANKHARDSSQVGVSLEAIRNEVKAALSKVSSSVDLVATAGINHNNLTAFFIANIYTVRALVTPGGWRACLENTQKHWFTFLS